MDAVDKWRAKYKTWVDANTELLKSNKIVFSKSRVENSTIVAKKMMDLMNLVATDYWAEIGPFQNVRTKGRDSLWFGLNLEHGEENQAYLAERGWCECANMMFATAALDAINGLQNIKKYPEMQEFIKKGDFNFAHLLFVLYLVQDHDSLSVVRKYRGNENAFPEEDMNLIYKQIKEMNLGFLEEKQKEFKETFVFEE